MTALAATQSRWIEALYAESPPDDPRMATYYHNARANWHGALATAYPVVGRLVGDAFFQASSAAYARAYPSRSGDLNAFGKDFAAFLAEYRPASCLEYLADVARLEWALHECFHAADAGPFDFPALGRVAAESYAGLRFRLHPAVRLVESRHPIVAIWDANQPPRDGTPACTQGHDHALVSRQVFGPTARSLARADWVALSAFARGDTLAEICDALADDAAQIRDILARFASEGVVCGFDAAS